MANRIAYLLLVLAMVGAPELSAQGTPTDGAPVRAEALGGQPPVLIEGSCQAPVYPAMLRAAHMEGRVRLQFVVDTLGRVEPSSVRPIQSTHSQFVDAARRALLTCRYRPARFQEAPVRVLVQAPFVFTLPRS